MAEQHREEHECEDIKAFKERTPKRKRGSIVDMGVFKNFVGDGGSQTMDFLSGSVDKCGLVRKTIADWRKLEKNIPPLERGGNIINAVGENSWDNRFKKMLEEDDDKIPKRDSFVLKRSRSAKPTTIHGCAQSGDFAGFHKLLRENPPLLNDRNPVLRLKMADQRRETEHECEDVKAFKERTPKRKRGSIVDMGVFKNFVGDGGSQTMDFLSGSVDKCGLVRKTIVDWRKLEKNIPPLERGGNIINAVGENSWDNRFKKMLEEDDDKIPKRDSFVLKRSRSAKPTTIHGCAQSGDFAGFHKLLRENPPLLNDRNPVMAHTPLHISAGHNSVEIVKVLLDRQGPKKIELEAKNMYGETPLHMAAKNGSNEAAQKLLAHGAFVEAKANNGMTPLHLAVLHSLRAGDCSTVKTLLEYNADCSAKDNEGRTPLNHLSQGPGNEKLRKLLNMYLEEQRKGKAEACSETKAKMDELQ